MPCLALGVPGENLPCFGKKIALFCQSCRVGREGGRLKLLLNSSLPRPTMNEHVGLLQIYKQTDFYKALANEPSRQLVLSVICGESVKDSTWGAH